MKDLEFKTANPCYYKLLKEFAKENRKKPTEAEAILWDYIKNRQLGQPFRRQHIIGDYIVDFACIPLKLIIEIDGGYHHLPNQQMNDEQRQKWLEKRGFTVLRFSNEEIIADTNNVIKKIRHNIS